VARLCAPQVFLAKFNYIHISCNFCLSSSTSIMSGSSGHPHDAEVPSISVTTDVTTPPPSPHSRLPSSGLLSPSGAGLRGQLSTHSDMSEAGSVPPSPTLSSHTANFPTTLQLRDNKPDAQSGLTSLNLLGAGGITSQQKNSSVTVNTDLDGETFRSASVSLSPSAATLATNADILGSEKRSKDPTADEQDKQKKRKKGKKEDDAAETNMTSHQRELAQDESIDPSPFRYKPFQLAHILDPKDLETLASFGGTDGLIRGLGTHTERGLTTTVGQVPQGTGQGVSQSRDSEKQTESSESGGGLPNIILTEPSGKEGLPSEEDNNAPYAATIDDRKRVYGENILPSRISKTLLQLMLAAMKDKVLVCSGVLSQHTIVSALIVHD